MEEALGMGLGCGLAGLRWGGLGWAGFGVGIRPWDGAGDEMKVGIGWVWGWDKAVGWGWG